MHRSFKKRICYSLAGVGVFLYGTWAAAQKDPPQKDIPRVEQWWELGKFDDDTLKRLDSWGDQIPYIIFNALNDITLFKNDSDNIQIDLSGHRRIFENHDRQGSWTVADRFSVVGTIPLYSYLVNGSMGQVGPTFGFSIGANTGVDFINIRQVIPDAYANLPSPKERKINIQDTPWSSDQPDNTPPTTPPPGKWMYSEDPLGQRILSYLPVHPNDHIRYTNLWRIPLIPLRLPLLTEAIHAMEDKEIISYVGFGSLQVGPSVGWSADPTGLTPLSWEVLSYATYVQGTYRISVMKESDYEVRLKISRIGEIGHAGSASGGTKPTIFDGMIIVKHFSSAIKIIPFQLKVGQGLADSFDVSYRYNLRIPHAKEAYEQAVLGRTALSEHLAIDPQGQPTTFTHTGVEKLSIRESTSDKQAVSRRMKLGFIFKRESGTSFINTDSVITLPDGKHHIFHSVVDNSQQWHLIFSFFEKLNHSFRVSVDLDKYQANPRSLDAMMLNVEGSIQDSDTSPNEMMSYMLEVEDSIGKFGIFPRPPKVDTDLPAALLDDLGMSLTNLGTTRFFYRMGLDQKTVDNFILTDETQMWKILETAFNVTDGYWSNSFSRSLYQLLSLPITIINVPLYVADINLRSGSNLWHARKILSRWKAIKEQSDIKKRAEALGNMFFDSMYSYELVRILRAALQGQDVNYWVSGYSTYFGQRWEHGDTTLLAENKASQLQREIDFDVPGRRGPDNSGEPEIDGLEITRIDSNKILITFNLTEIPQALFFQINTSNPWWVFSNGRLAHLLMYNNGMFKKGENKLVLDKKNATSPGFPLIEKVESGTRYILQISSNMSGLTWSPLIETPFRMR